MKKLIGLMISLTLVLSFCAYGGQPAAEQKSESGSVAESTSTNPNEDTQEETFFSQWNPDAASLQALINYVETVTDETSPDYIPPEDRIAAFDMDGTLYGELAPTYVEWCIYAYRVNEDSSFLADQDEKDVADQIVDVMKTGVIPENLEKDHAVIFR